MLDLLALLLLASPALAAQGDTEPSDPEAGTPAVAEAQEALPEGESRLISLDELEAVPAGENVTVLFPFTKAEAVSASSSVTRSFHDGRALRVQADARANAVFVSGEATLVREAVVRMRALDEATPERPTRPSRNTNMTVDPVEGPLSVGESYGDGATQVTSRAGFLIAGLVGLALAGLILLRRFTR